ncbi:hypothetical protein GIB67_008018 [Kingdonia uniflora]|uniref:Uncharacterized protein n=1 Tax=Kingdonia uniflora TaxID=39325 RepID=A0A7J7MXB2_9MAGN|nr:hypothetical protein GIB67_008018 [Kingdonia uniflora]
MKSDCTKRSRKITECAVVIGRNKGIGLEICQQLASNGILVVLTARDEKKGNEAIKNLKELEISNAVFHQLDIKDPTSIASLASFIKTRFGKLDIQVNNGRDPGVVIDLGPFKAFGGFNFVLDENAKVVKDVIDQSYDKVKECLKINYYGTKGVTKVIFPLLQFFNSTRIVNASSVYGLLSVG